MLAIPKLAIYRQLIFLIVAYHADAVQKSPCRFPSRTRLLRVPAERWPARKIWPAVSDANRPPLHPRPKGTLGRSSQETANMSIGQATGAPSSTTDAYGSERNSPVTHLDYWDQRISRAE